MMTSKKSNFKYIIDDIFNPVVSECKNDIELILGEDPELKSEVEKKLERILINRAIKKALSAEPMVTEKISKEYSTGQIILNSNSKTKNKFKESGTKFTFCNKANSFLSREISTYNRMNDSSKKVYSYSAIEISTKEIVSNDPSNNNLASAI